ncbi:restriction endonuclease subunit S, partial [Tabrizicola sp.]|uniref:restriction endonuclease subunit S n=1 Tax=Tabrizicola sp. TaxID=2005166 RepID=UPI001A62630A
TAFSQTYNDFGLAQSKLWPEGTVCITIAANIAETAILGFPACFPDSIIGMVCDPEKVRAEYIELMLRYFAADLKEQGKGSAQDNINLATFEQSFFPIPGIAEQARIVEQLSEIAQERRNLEAHFIEVLNSLDTLRQSLLQKTFSGELT